MGTESTPSRTLHAPTAAAPHHQLKLEVLLTEGFCRFLFQKWIQQGRISLPTNLWKVLKLVRQVLPLSDQNFQKKKFFFRFFSIFFDFFSILFILEQFSCSFNKIIDLK